MAVEKIEFKPQKGPQEVALASPADISIFGGARGGGKTFVLLLEALRNIKNQRFQAVIFRRTYPQILQPEGLWETSTKVYPYTGAAGSQGNLLWKFPSGARVSFSHMENESDKDAWLGAGIPLIGFDELITFSRSQFFSCWDPTGQPVE